MPSLAEEARAALTAVTFLTRLPIGGAWTFDGDDVQRAGAYFPLAGALVGAVTQRVADRQPAAVALCAQALLTGALHLDALADSADALGTRDPARALEIMRDSRIGSFGTVAIALDLLLRHAALSRPEGAPLVAAGALSRAVPVMQAALVPYARTEGTAAALSRGSLPRAAVAACTAALLGGPRATAIAAGVAVASGRFWERRVGGVTGDTLGAALELTETAILLWA